MNSLSHYSKINPFTTKDGSVIRELMHPDQHGNKNQSLAEAIVSAGQETRLHKHLLSEELYHITQGQGMMTLGEQTFEVESGDTIEIAPGTAHKIVNTGKDDLVILCCCSPAYKDADTELL